jgi:hypothetical protein
MYPKVTLSFGTVVVPTVNPVEAPEQIVWLETEGESTGVGFTLTFRSTGEPTQPAAFGIILYVTV